MLVVPGQLIPRFLRLALCGQFSPPARQKPGSKTVYWVKWHMQTGSCPAKNAKGSVIDLREKALRYKVQPMNRPDFWRYAGRAKN